MKSPIRTVILPLILADLFVARGGGGYSDGEATVPPVQHIGSNFKLWVLGALGQAVKEGVITSAAVLPR